MRFTLTSGFQPQQLWEVNFCLYKSPHPWAVVIASQMDMLPLRASGGPSVSFTMYIKNSGEKSGLSPLLSVSSHHLLIETLSFWHLGTVRFFSLPFYSAGSRCLLPPLSLPLRWDPGFPFPGLSSSLFSAAQMQHYRKVPKSEDNY